MPSYFTGIDERVENISISLVSSLQLSKLSSVSLELVDGCRVESVEIQPDTTLVICVFYFPRSKDNQSSLTCAAR